MTSQTKNNLLRKLSTNLIILSALISLTSISSCDQNKTTDIKISIHTESPDLLLQWFDNKSDSITQSLLKQPGTQIMAGIVKNTLHDDNPPSFGDALNNFSPNDSLTNDPYGLRLAYLQRDETSVLINKIKMFDFGGEVIARIKAYIPSDYSLNINSNVHFVLTGWKWGDAMVRNVVKENNCYKVTEQGEPVIIMNLSIMTKLYGDDMDMLLKENVSQIMSHELFHLTFEEYKKVSDYWQNNNDTTYIGRLAKVIQNEGIAHFLSNNMKQYLTDNYNSSENLKNREKLTFNQLNDAVKQLVSTELNEQEKYNLLMSANTGNYWNKYGAIAGKFMVYHIENKYGAQAIQESLSKGAYYFLQLYNNVQLDDPSLPKLPKELIDIIKL
ncbi:MAG: hypothetical protein JXA53_08325 [Bacteroidales bacterium]|nr:hypothetical protein [Bacteroidales bacterium]